MHASSCALTNTTDINTFQGLLLLWQSGLMTLCTQYMHQRYKLKMQVCTKQSDV